MKQAIKLYHVLDRLCFLIKKRSGLPYSRGVSFMRITVVGFIAFSLWSCSRMAMGMDHSVSNQGQKELSDLPKESQDNRWEILQQELKQELALAREIQAIVSHLIQLAPSSSVSFLSSILLKCASIPLKYARIVKIAGGAIAGLLVGIGTEALISYMYANYYLLFSAADNMSRLLNDSLSEFMPSVLKFETMTGQKGTFHFINKMEVVWIRIHEKGEDAATADDLTVRLARNYDDFVMRKYANPLTHAQAEVIKRTLHEDYGLVTKWLPFIQATALGVAVAGYNLCTISSFRGIFLEKKSNEALKKLSNDVRMMYQQRVADIMDKDDILDHDYKTKRIENTRKDLEWLCRNLPWLVENIESFDSKLKKEAIEKRLQELLYQIQGGTYGVYGNGNEASCSSRQNTVGSAVRNDLQITSQNWVLSRCYEEVECALYNLRHKKE